jgi:hypothetical protein
MTLECNSMGKEIQRSQPSRAQGETVSAASKDFQGQGLQRMQRYILDCKDLRFCKISREVHANWDQESFMRLSRSGLGAILLLKRKPSI